MKHIFRQKLIVLVVLLLPFVKHVIAQNDTIPPASDSINSVVAYPVFNSGFLRHLPVTNTSDILQLNPQIYRTVNNDEYLINGFSSLGDYTWFDGVPMSFTSEMPLRLIGSVNFNDDDAYLNYGNSINGFASLEPVRSSDSLTFLAESSSRLIYGQFNDADLQFLLSGPLINPSHLKNDITSVNFTFSGRLFSSADNDPSYISRDRASEEWMSYLDNEPLRPGPYGEGTYANALYTHEEDAVSSYFNSKAAKKGFSLFGNIRADLHNGMFVKFGTYTVNKEETLPVYANFFYNQDNNPVHADLYSTNYLLFGQRVKTRGAVTLAYEVQGQYSLQKSKTANPDLENDFFKYGYVGKFDSYKSPTFEIGSDSVDGTFYEQAWILNSWDYDTLVEFTPGIVNPELTAYTASYYSIYEGEPDGHFENMDQVQLGGGLLNGQNPDMVYDLWNNAGTVYNSYTVDNQSRVNISLDGMLEKGNHKIVFGFQYRKDNYSSYQANPMGLWGLMRNLTNFHIRELDLSNPFVHEGEMLDTIYYYRKYDARLQHSFDRNLREALGLDPEGIDFIDIDSYDYAAGTINYYDKDGGKHTIDCGKDLFSLNMFSADELLNDGIVPYVSYSGYDHLGNRNREDVSFEDFFDATDEEGAFIRPVGSYTPVNYSAFAGYHYDLGGWSFDAGLRLEAFDSHQQVLEDPYLFYEAYTVEELRDIPDFPHETPDGIGQDFIVYVDNGFNPVQVTGYRDGDHWFDSEGNSISDPNVLDVGSGICPYLKNPDQERISASVFTRNKTWLNFLPQVNIQKSFNNMLLITFRYNSSVLNPVPELTFSNPAAYYFINNASGWIPNGSLKPERTDKFRAGISVMPAQNLVITAEAFLDYFSDMIYLVRRVGAYPKDYTTYYNEEEAFAQYGFDITLSRSSVKSSGFNYGLSYHFVINKENPAYHVYDFRVPKNLVKGYLQFNTGFGKDYYGPSGEVNYEIFSGLGMGLYGQFQSGVYYMSLRNPDGWGDDLVKSPETMPGQAFFDLKIEKGFQFKNGKYHLNLHCVIQNLFNTKVIYKVYRFTGQPDDNGFLTAPESQHIIAEALDEESFRYLYASYINDPNNYGLPRRTTLGISFNF